MNKTKFIIFIAIAIIFAMLSESNAAWVETQNYGLGTFGFPNIVGNFAYIPECPYLIFYSYSSSPWNGIMTIDISTGKLRDGMTSEHLYYTPVLVPDAESGWNLFFLNKGTYGKLHINTNGEFGEEKWFDRTDVSSSRVAIPESHEIWFFSKKILHLNTTTEEWTEYSYPDGWDSDHDYVWIYPSEDLGTLIARAQVKSTGNYQAMWFNLKTGESKMIHAEADFFVNIEDIDMWKGNPGKYIILKHTEIWSYDSTTDKFALLMKDYKGYSGHIMQSQSGQYLYTLGEGNSLFVNDLINKTTATHLIPLHEKDEFSGSYTFDSERNRIITRVGNKEKTGNGPCLILDLTDYSIHYLTGFPEMSISIFLQRQNMIIGHRRPYIYFFDLETEEASRSTPIFGQCSTWSAIPGEDAPTFIPDSYTSNLIMLEPLGGKEILSSGFLGLSVTLMYPGANIAFFKTGSKSFREYYFDDNTTGDFELPGESTWYFQDPNNKQIITFYRGLNATVQFIKPRGKVRAWSPEGLDSLNATNYLFDPDHDVFWTIYKHRVTSEWYFYQLSTKTQKLLDSFVVPSNQFDNITSISIDPSGKRFYIINTVTVNNAMDRYLLVFDIEQRIVFRGIKLQEHVVEAGTTSRVRPCVIPIPGRDRLFIWLHDRSWCINTNTWETPYGELQVDPKAQYEYSFCSEGFWDEARQRVVVFDFCYDVSTQKGVRSLEIDPENGFILKEEKFKIDLIQKFFCSADKKKVYMLNYDRPLYYVFNLDPVWENPAIVEPETNFLDYAPGDNCRLTVNIKNGEMAQNVRLYIWLRVPGGTYLFYNGKDFVPEVVSIGGYLPANMTDLKVDLVNFTIPEIMPPGFYNLNAMFTNERFEFGPMGTWNFNVGR